MGLSFFTQLIKQYQWIDKLKHHKHIVWALLLSTGLISLLLLSACQSSSDTVRKAEMHNTAGDVVGKAILTEHPNGVMIKLNLEGLTQGFHGIHVHEFPSCQLPDFKSAGNHLNPENKEHGLLHPKGAHLGDLPNIEADGSGKVDVELLLADATLLEGKKSLLNEKGTSLVITQDKDDGISQPSGDSGERIICGEIKAVQKEESESSKNQTEVNKEESN